MERPAEIILLRNYKDIFRYSLLNYGRLQEEF